MEIPQRANSVCKRDLAGEAHYSMRVMYQSSDWFFNRNSGPLGQLGRLILYDFRIANNSGIKDDKRVSRYQTNGRAANFRVARYPGTSLRTRTRPRSHPDETELCRLFLRRFRTAHFSADRRTEVCQLV